MRPYTSDYLKLHFIVFLWGSTAILGVLISIPAVEMVFYRTFLASIIMAIVIYLSNGLFKLPLKEIIRVLLTGLIIGAHWIFFFGSAKISNVPVSLVGYATCTLWSACIEPIVYKRSIKILELVLGLTIIEGLYVILSSDFRFQTGLLLAIGSGLTAAIFSVINSKFIKRIPAYTITFYEMIGACMGIVLFFPFYKTLWAEGGELQLNLMGLDYVYIAVLAIVCSVYAYSVSVELMKRLSVFFIQLTFSLEPVYGIVMALLIFGAKEQMQFHFYLGASLIITSVILYPFLKIKFYRHHN